MLLPDSPRLRPEEEQDLSWMNIGLCRPGGPEWVDGHARRHGFPNKLAMFFPERGQNTDAAVSVCKDCPVLDECQAYALREPAIQGIWGATTGRQRSRIRGGGETPPARRRRRKPRFEHGTMKGYRRHLDEGTRPCDHCREARRTYTPGNT